MNRDNKRAWEMSDYGMYVLKSDWYKMMFSLQNIFVKASMEFYYGKGLQYVPLSVTTNSISSPMGLGSDSLPVEAVIKGKKTFLADSMQFLLEYVTRMANYGGFYLMPSFRGEPTNDRHLAQFFHSEAEIKGNLNDVIMLVNEYVAYLSEKILEEMSDEVCKYTGDVKHLEYLASKPTIERITHSEAIEFLQDIPGTIDVLDGNFKNINRYGEKALMEKFGGYVWLTNFPDKIVPFYQAQDNGVARNADFLMGIGETVGAGERNVTADEVKSALARHNNDPQPYDWYIQMKKEFPLKTSGFGLGMERFLLWVLKHDDIRSCQIVSRIDNTEMKP